jgi:LacI family transcriptional regulator
VPTVAIGDALESADTVGDVLFDNDRGVQAMLRHLRELGHERVAVLSWALDQAPGRSAESAVEQWAAELGLECQLLTCAYSLNGSRPLARDVLTSDPRPTAIFALSDSIAYGVYVACHELGLRIPEDVSVAGYDDHPISRLLAPPLTSIDWSIDQIAATACAFLLDALRESDGTRQRAILPPHLNARGSTGLAPASS